MDVETIFNPKSVALIGASSNPNKWGNWIAEQLLRHQDKRDVYLVNHNGGDVFGKTCLKSIEELPDNIDLAVLAIPRDVVEQVAMGLVMGKKVKYVHIVTSGFAEMGEWDMVCELRFASVIRQFGGELIGPNSAGIWDSYSPFHCLPVGEYKPGKVSVISQSGGVITDLYLRLQEAGIGFSKVISIGNVSNTRVKEYLAHMERDSNTEVIAVYLEDFQLIPFEELNGCTKPVVLMAPKYTGASELAALNHTGSHLGEVYNIARSMREFAAVVQLHLSKPKKPVGNKVMVVTDSGGLGVMAAAECQTYGLDLPQPSDAMYGRLMTASKEIRIFNPIDMVNIPSGFCDATVSIMEDLQTGREYNCMIMILYLTESNQSEHIEYSIGKKLAEQVRDGTIPVVFVCKDFNAPGVLALLDNGMAVYRDIETAATMVASLCT